MLSYTHIYLKEANLADFEPLTLAINKILDDRNITTGPIRKWFNTQFIKWFKSNVDDDKKPIKPHTYKDGEPQWMSSKDIVDFTNFNAGAIKYIDTMINYFDSLEDNELKSIYKEPYSVIAQKVADWEEDLKDRDIFVLKPKIDYKVILKTTDGRNNPMVWIKLLTQHALTVEGELMDHCTGDAYDITTYGQSIFSLRDEKFNPHITMSTSGKNIDQIKGHGNSQPAEKYKKPVIEFIKSLMAKKYKVIDDGEGVGMEEYRGVYYFPDDEKWVDLYNNVILPTQRKVVDELRSRLVTVAGESVNLVESYINNLKRNIRYSR
jgi:hypothetical protein